MRHSRRLSSHPAQPQGPFCTHCEVNLSAFPAYIRCADLECRSIPICVDCFSVGAADEPPHQPSHPYRIVQKLSQSIYVDDWAAHEELRLLEALSEHGPHHWKAIADYVGKTQRKCELHYESLYLNGPNAPLPSSMYGQSAPAPSPAASSDAIDESDVPDTKPAQDDPENANTGNQRKLKNKDSESESGILEGFMPLRGDFDVEWDDKAEELIADLIINADDTPEEKELKMRLLIMYDQRLQRRNAVKEFLFDHKLLEFAKLKYDDRRGTRDEKELSARLQVFSRLLSKPEFDAFYSSVMTEYRISRDMYRMAQARKAGIRTKPEVDIYEVERKARYQRLGEQVKSKGTEKSVGKRRRPSAASDTPTPTPTPLNSVPGTPGSLVLSPSDAIPPEGDDKPEKQNESNAVRARKARERKRIARSPYPVLEAMPVEEMEDAWKLSQTEKKLCSALRIPPSEFLRMRDAMLYTASQNIKRRGRPRKRGTNTPVLTIRAKRQAKAPSTNQPRQRTQLKQEPAMVLDTVPLTLPHQQRVILRQATPTPPPNSGPRIMLTCKPPATAAGGSETKAPTLSSTPISNATDKKLRLSLKLVPADPENPSAQPPAKKLSSVPTARGVEDTDDLPLSATFAQSQHRKELTRITPTIAVETATVMNAQETVPTKASETLIDGTKEVVVSKAIEVTKSDAKEENLNDLETKTKTNPGENSNLVLGLETMEIKKSLKKVESSKDAEKDSRDETPESKVSCEADIVHVSTLDRPRPVTRSYAKQATQTRESIRMHLTRVSRSNSPCKGPEKHEIRTGPKRTVVNVTVLQVERPVTRAFAAQAPPKLENFESQPSSPILKSAKEDEEDDDSETKPPDYSARARGSTNENVKHEGTSNDYSDAGIQPNSYGTAVQNGKDPIETKMKGGRSSGSSNAHDDDSSSRDDVDEVLCGEDGAKLWSPRVKGLDRLMERPSQERTGNASPDVLITDGPVKDGTVRNGLDGEELLDHGRASVDSTGRASHRLAKKQPKTPERVSQRLRSKKAVTEPSTLQRFAKKHPRCVRPEGQTPREALGNSHQSHQRQMETNRETKETEETIDGEGEVDGEQNTRMAERDDGILDGSDSVEILSGGEGDHVDPTEKNSDPVEEVTLDEGQDAVGEEGKDLTWTAQDSDSGDGPEDDDNQTKRRCAGLLDKPSSQTEAGTEPGTPETSDHDRELQQFGNLKQTADERRKHGRATDQREAIPAIRKSRRVQKPSRRLEESVEASIRPAKRRRTSGRETRSGPVTESPTSDSEAKVAARSCTVITDQVGNDSFDDLERTEADGGTVSKRFRPDTPRSKKSSRQNTPSRLRYPVTERRVTRSAGRQTRSRSASMRRSLTDRLVIRRG